jgi:hypothetical protein
MGYRNSAMPAPYTPPMNINQSLAAVALLVLTGGIAMAAYGLRYTPVQGDGFANPVTVWDRWEREVCQVSLIDGYPVACSRTSPYKR